MGGLCALLPWLQAAHVGDACHLTTATEDAEGGIPNQEGAEAGDEGGHGGGGGAMRPERAMREPWGGYDLPVAVYM